MNRNSEFAQPPHMMPDQPLPFAFFGQRPVRLLPRQARAEGSMHHYCQRMGHGDQRRLAAFFGAHSLKAFS